MGRFRRIAVVTQQAESSVDDDPSLGVHVRNRKRWWHRHLDSEERQRVMTELAIRRQDHGWFRFGLMIALSVVVAVMGMSADSAAVVIGAPGCWWPSRCHDEEIERALARVREQRDDETTVIGS